MVKHHDVVGRYVTIEVDDREYKVFYLQNGKGIPLICQHTAGCHNHQWRGLLEDEEIIKNYNVIAPELPVYTSKLLDTNVKFFAKFVNEFVKFKKLKDFVIVGNSLGGHVGLIYAKFFPS